MKGEELRSRRDPSVSELLARRVNDVARSAAGFSLNHACSLALILERWDHNAALPVIRRMTDRCLEDIDTKRGYNAGVNLDEVISDYFAKFTLIRAEAGDLAALDEYAVWFRKTRPEELKYRAVDCLQPLWKFPEHPAILEAARWLFNDAQSPWIPLLRDPGKSRRSAIFHHRSLFASPLVCSPGFREGLLAAMANKIGHGHGPSRWSTHPPI